MDPLQFLSHEDYAAAEPRPHQRPKIRPPRKCGECQSHSASLFAEPNSNPSARKRMGRKPRRQTITRGRKKGLIAGSQEIAQSRRHWEKGRRRGERGPAVQRKEYWLAGKGGNEPSGPQSKVRTKKSPATRCQVPKKDARKAKQQSNRSGEMEVVISQKEIAAAVKEEANRPNLPRAGTKRK